MGQRFSLLRLHGSVLTGADFGAALDGTPVRRGVAIDVATGQTLALGRAVGGGMRGYVLFAGGLDIAPYLGSRSTFELGQFGGHAARRLLAGDTLHLGNEKTSEALPTIALPELSTEWTVRVLYGPHGAPDFFTDEDIDSIVAAEWQVHYNSNRTGVRLIGPKPRWARADGGEAGLHPSNIHDNPYAIGAVDFTGDMPIILGPDGPSLGGFVCPFVVIAADRWKIGQLTPGDKLRFAPVNVEDATVANAAQRRMIATGTASKSMPGSRDRHALAHSRPDFGRARPSAHRLPPAGRPEHPRRIWADRARHRAPHPRACADDGAGAARSPRHHRHRARHPLAATAFRRQEHGPACRAGCAYRRRGAAGRPCRFHHPSRIVHLPLSWRDPATIETIEKYMGAVRDDAPWCPDNIEFIRRINGLPDVAAVENLIFDANYLVLGLGDVYLGAPVATPIDPRHRLVTTKYNPARTWTPPNVVESVAPICASTAWKARAAINSSVGPSRCGTRIGGPTPLSMASLGCCVSSTRSASIRSARKS